MSAALALQGSERRKAEHAGIVLLLETNTGYCIDVVGLVSVYQLEDLRFAVVEDSSEAHKYFDTASEAADYFLARRDALEAGFDYERVKTVLDNGGA